MRPILLEVDEHDALPDGCCQRFSALDEPRPVQLIDEDGVVSTVAARESDGSEGPALAVLVDDSAGGQSVLVYGGTHGLRVRHPDGTEVAEPYLLLSPDVALT